MSNASRMLFVFPGQGSQYRGMGSDLYERYQSAKRVYETASDVLGYDIARLCFVDPNQQLDLTRFTQPALLTHHIACLEVYRELAEHPVTPSATAGHSLGEYTALVAAGALSFEDGLRLVQVRGQLMGTFGEGEMLALPLDLATVRPLADQYYCGISGLNLPQQTVVGGATEDLDALAQAVSLAFPNKRAVRLRTEGAFHTFYMIEAAKRFRSVLADTAMSTPKVRVLSNYLGNYHEPDPDTIRSRLFFQLFHPVDWYGCLQAALADHIDSFVEFGGGIGRGETPAEKRPNLESIIRRVARQAPFEVNYSSAINNDSIADLAAK